MRDLHLRHTLKQLSRDASAVFADLIAAGQEIPYEIAEPGEGSALCQYRPLTAKFVRDNATELRELETFREATETMRRSDLGASYLEEAGIVPPADPVERSTLAVTYFLARLWDGCSDFELDEDRFDAALDEVDECGEPEAGEVEAIVPLIGLRMDVARVELSGAAIVRADTVDAPPEAGKTDRRAGEDWEPTFLLSAMIELDPDGGLAGTGGRVAATFERVVTTLRLHKRGGVGIGPHGWVRIAGDRWRRIATGAGRPRAGGYRIEDAEISELVDLARTVAVHPKRIARLRRALLRFESGLDRRGAVDALNDHLLALRFLLEGEGPAGVGLPMRAAAIAASGEERIETKETIEAALALERELWSGEPTGESAGSPSQVAARVEDVLRTILTRAVSGELGSDARVAADETLLADGLAIGEGSDVHGGTSEWELEPETHEVEAAGAEAFDRFENDPEPEIRAAKGTGEPVAGTDPHDRGTTQFEPEEEMPVIDDIERQLDAEPAAEAAEESPAASARPPRRHPIPFGSEPPEQSPIRSERLEPVEEPEAEEQPIEAPDWLQEVDSDDGLTMDFPQRENHLEELARPPMEREEVKARVEYLFPRTETDWTVGEGGPDRSGAATG